jgi:predicted nuclease of predicted toxin-antitoxin system
MKFLIDECLHTSLVTVANDAGFEAHHVVHLGLQGTPDHKLMGRIRDDESIFVTNNALDFVTLYANEEIHPGLVIILRNVPPNLQRALFQAALEFIGEDEPVNCAIEVELGWIGDQYRSILSQQDRAGLSRLIGTLHSLRSMIRGLIM